MASPQHAQGQHIAIQADQAHAVLMDQIRTIFGDGEPSLAGTDMASAQAAIEQVRQADHDLVSLLKEAEGDE